MGDRSSKLPTDGCVKIPGGITSSQQQFPPYRVHIPPNSASNGQIHSTNFSLLDRWRDLHRAVDRLRHDIPVVAKSTPYVSAGCIRVEVPDVVRVYVRFHDAGAMGEDSVW